MNADQPTRKWIDGESYLLLPTGIGLFIIGTCGMLATDDLLACFIAGTWLNWDGQYLQETEARHDEVNSVVDVILNFGGFMFIGMIIPWREFQDPEGTGITVLRLIGLGMSSSPIPSDRYLVLIPTRQVYSSSYSAESPPFS
jgi:sodium/hydrogen antiporter